VNVPDNTQKNDVTNATTENATPTLEHRSRVVVLTTGGTIAIDLNSTAQGTPTFLTGQHLLEDSPVDPYDVHVEEMVALPSSHFQIDTLWSIHDRVAEIATEPAVTGIVLTHGTDTLEETAYLLDLTIPGEKPIVLTGSMRTHSDTGYDGRANLRAAINTAAAPAARELGAVVVMNNEIHSARLVTKAHTLNPAAFESPGWGPIGYISGTDLVIAHRLSRQLLPWQGLEPNVALLKVGVAVDTSPIENALSEGARGIVIEAFGSGRLPPWWMPAIKRAHTLGIPVVVASRCSSGPMGDSYSYDGAYQDLKKLGCIFADDLNGQKARIKLMVILAAAQTPNQVSGLW
jgi:L-asparaginase